MVRKLSACLILVIASAGACACSGTVAGTVTNKADQKPLPASTFDIPAGYTKSTDALRSIMGGGSGPQSDEARKKMGEAGKNLTPEQKQLLEKMMKDRKAGNQ